MLEVSVVIPAYNERENIERTVEEVYGELSARGYKFEIVVVDDLSPDGTGEVVKKLERRLPGVRLVTNEHKKGIGYALAKGYDAAAGEVIVSTDADNSVDPAFITKALRKLDEGYGMVVGCRHCPGGYYEAKEEWYNFVRIPISKAGNAFTRALTGIPVNDFSLNFRVFRRDLWKNMHCSSHGNAFMLEVVYKAAKLGVRVAQIPVHFLERKKGATKTRVGKETLKFFKRLLELKFIEKDV